ncbi:hypothetical protein TrRE_jg12552, partial [Triparma retinervis]
MLPANITLQREQTQTLTNEYFPPTEDLFEVSARKKLAHNNAEELAIVPESLFGREKFKEHVQVSKQITDSRTITVCSYNTLSQEDAKNLPYVEHSVSNWVKRRQTLLHEIFSFDADIICLQSVDDFAEWWRPQLSQAGYDAIFKKRTEHLRPRQDGVVVAYKRDSFQMFRSETLELNDAVTDDLEDRNLAARAITDHVAIMVCLQPWEKCDDPTGVCVSCVAMEEEPNLETVRLLQSTYMAHKIEKFNADFQLPVIMAGTLNCMPGGKVYEVLTTGMTPIDPQAPGVPVGGDVRVGLDRFHGGKAVSRSSVVLTWNECEDLDNGLSPPVLGYYVTWRIGGNQNLAFKEKRYYPKENCVVARKEGESEEDYDPKLRTCVVTGLSSGVTYEFKVAGFNECGIGDWTKVSEPICTERLQSKLSAGPKPERRTVTISSSHPYKPCMDLKDEVLLRGCKFGAKVEFHRKTKLEMDADILCFYEDETYDEVLSARTLVGEEMNCVFDGEYRTDPDEFPVLVEVCREGKGLGEFNIDKKFYYGFFSDEQNEYWGYSFTVTWDDYTEVQKWENEIEALKGEKNKRGKWLSDIKEVKTLQVHEEKVAVEAKKRALQIRKELMGTIMINGKETVLPVSKITPRFMDGTENRLVAPVRKQQLPLFPSFGNRGDDMDGDGESDDGFDENGMLVSLLNVAAEEEEGGGGGGGGGAVSMTIDSAGNLVRANTSNARGALVLATDNIEQAWRDDAERAHDAIIGQPDIVGSPDARQVHYLKLKSAYRGYCAAGEPLYTSVGAHGANTSDYILASEEMLVCVDVLSIPILGGRDGEELNIANDIRENEVIVDMNYDLDGFDDI